MDSMINLRANFKVVHFGLIVDRFWALRLRHCCATLKKRKWQISAELRAPPCATCALPSLSALRHCATCATTYIGGAKVSHGARLSPGRYGTGKVVLRFPKRNGQRKVDNFAEPRLSAPHGAGNCYRGPGAPNILVGLRGVKACAPLIRFAAGETGCRG